MGTYQVPRNVKGEGRILFIFSVKALIYSVCGAGIGLVFKILFGLFNLNIVGYVLIVFFALVGFAAGTFKVPESTAFSLTKSVGGENIDEVIKRAIKFRKNGNKIYIHKNSTLNETQEKNTNEKKEEYR